MSSWIKLGLGLMAIAADVAFTYFGSPLVSARRRLVVAGAAMGPFFLAMPELLTRYRDSTFARILFGPPPPPTIVHQAPPLSGTASVPRYGLNFELFPTFCRVARPSKRSGPDTPSSFDEILVKPKAIRQTRKSWARSTQSQL